MKNNRTQYTKYHEKMEKLIAENKEGDFCFIPDEVFDAYGEYFIKTIKKDKPFKLYRYTSLYRYISLLEYGAKEYEAIYDKKIYKKVFSLDLENIYLTQNGGLNDIFEGLPDSDYDYYSQEKCIENLRKIAYIKCFSETYTNNLMWAHYADSYNGICIEYDVSKLTDKKIIKQIFPVCYFKNRNMYADVTLLSEFVKGDKDLEATKDAKGIFLSKSDVWKYEKEWRICVMNDENSKENVEKTPFDCISAIYMGIRIEEKDVVKVIEALNEYNKKHKVKTVDKIKLYKMKMPKDNSYNLTSEEVNY